MRTSTRFLARQLFALAALLGGCASVPPTPQGSRATASGPAEAVSGRVASTPADAARLGRLLGWHTRLGAMLASVERELLDRASASAVASATADHAPATASPSAGDQGLEALRHKRLVLHAALGLLDQAMARERLLARVDSSAAATSTGSVAAPTAGPAGTASAASPSDLGALLDEADQQVLLAEAALHDASGTQGQEDEVRRLIAELQEGRMKAAHAWRDDTLKTDEQSERYKDATGKLGGGRLSEKSKLKEGVRATTAPERPADGRLPNQGACAPGDPLCGTDQACHCVAGDPLCSCVGDDGSGGRGRFGGAAGAGGIAAAAVASNAAVLDGVMPVVRRRLGALVACLPAGQVAAGGVRLEVGARLTADGSFRDIRIGPAAEIAPTASACMADVLGQIRVPAPGGGASRVVSFPLWLAPGG